MPAAHTALPPWTCGICGIHDNWGTKARCRNCNAYPPASHRALVKGGQQDGKAKGKGKGIDNRINVQGKGNPINSSAYGSLGSFAHRQLQQARRGGNELQQTQAAFRSNARELQDIRRKNDGLLEQNKRLQKELDEAKLMDAQGHGDTDETMEEGPEELGDEERKGRMDKLRNSLPYLEETFGTDSSVYTDAVAELDHHQRTLRGAKPYKTHRTILERKVEKLRRQQGRDNDRLGELRDAAEEIQGKIATTTSAIAEREKELEAAEAELRELLLKAVGEEAAQPTTTPDPAQSWDNVVGAVAQLVKAPGVPQEFTCQLETMFNQLRSMVTTLQSHAAAVGAPSGLAQPAVCAGDTVEETPPLAAAEAEQLRNQQAAARRQRQQAAQTVHINRFITSQRSAQAGKAEGATVDNGHKHNAADSHPEADRTAEAEPAHGAASHSSSSGSHQAPAAAAAAAATATPTPAPTLTETSAAGAAADRGAEDDTARQSGGESDEENITDQEDMQVEEIGAKLSPEQKVSLRAMLQVRKARLARRTMRLKKPAIDEGQLSRDSKKR